MSEEIQTLEKSKKVSIKTDEEEELLFDLELPETPIKRPKGRPKKIIEETEDDGIPKKRELSEKQKETLKKCWKARQESFEKRQEERRLIEQEKQKEKDAKKREIERKILKKAICIKKKEVLSQAVLDEISDDDIPTEIVEKIIKKQRAKRVVPPVIKKVSEPVPEAPPPPKYTFVK